jgi:hypothetical protein
LVSAALLHPAERRRLAPLMPPEPHHEVVLRPLGAGDARTILATSKVRNFVEALFEDVAAPDWRARLAAMRGARRDADGVLRLSLPIHRKTQIALFEAVCAEPGTPRLDPDKIVSMGMVLRRRRHDWAGWMKRGKDALGWKHIEAGDADADPDPVRRQAAHPANQTVRDLIARRVPLHLAPPNVCAARGRTILFGIVPVMSSDEQPKEPLDYAALPPHRLTEMVAHLSEYLKARPQLAMPRRGQRLTSGWNVLDPPAPNSTEAKQLNAFGIFLQQLAIELDAFGQGPAAAALMSAYSGLRLTLARDARGNVTADIDAARFLRKAAAVMIERQPNSDNMTMPLEWPRIDAALGARLTRAALDCLSARHASLAPAPGKHDDARDQYAVRGFIRVRGPDGCPDRLVWSAYSEKFRIAPWWDGDGPGVKVSLPDLSQLKDMKPNFAFEMPPAIANMLKGDMKKLAEGEGSTSGLEVGWLCSFSLPIITLCAFIVLNIFLSLFDLFLRWMMFIKICIPIPKKG